MVIKTSIEKIWWDDNTDNKPGFTYFEDYKNRMIESKIFINQNSYDTLEIVVPDTTISYIWVNDGKYDYYYYYNRVVNVLPDCYRLEFKLDIFATFTLPYVKYLWDTDIPVKVNRHKLYANAALKFKDELLDAVPKTILKRVRQCSKERYWKYEANLSEGKPGYKFKPFWGDDDYIEAYTINKDNFLPTTVYIVVSGNDGYIWLIPSYDDTDTKPIYEKYFAPNPANRPWWWNPELGEEYMYITNRGVEWNINRIRNWEKGIFANKILGVFQGPPFYKFPKYNKVIQSFNYAGVANENFLIIKITASGVVVGTKQNKYHIGNIPDYMTYAEPERLNEDRHLFILAANFINIEVAGKPVDFYPLFNIPNLTFCDTAILNFSTSLFLYGRSEQDAKAIHILEYPANLPNMTDKYSDYLAATRNSRDTGLSIAKQQATLGTVSSLGSGLLGLAGAIGNPLGAAKSIFSTAQGITNNIIGYQNKKEMMNAELADKRAGIKDTIQSGGILETSAAINVLSFKETEGTAKLFLGETIEYDVFDRDTIMSLNNILYLYGNYYPTISELKNIAAKPQIKFDYFKFDSEYLSNIFSTTLRGAKEVPIQREYYNAIFNHLTEGIRLWKTKPEI